MLAFVLLIAATANTATTAPATTPTAAEPKKERMVCKTSKFVGSHVSRRICKTESEWEFAKKNAQDALDDRGRGGDHGAPWRNGPN